MKIVLLLGLVAAAMAACPDACSGHGTCGEHDMCTCFRNWMSANCAERVCPYDWAFVTTPQGDLNMNGDIYDSMSYLDVHFDDANVISTVKEKTNLLTQAAPGGTWEMWPSYAASAKDEAHFYMECSNRGLCDRKSGECDCFDGYEGAGCRRTVCPNACSGHGTCESVKEQTSTYKLWDGDKSMSCVCDPGYSGADCSSRKCPVGDDPLTTKTAASQAQKNENLWIDVDGFGGALSGYFQLKYTDDFGEEWWTDYIEVVDYATGTAVDSAGKVEAALEGIPNGVFADVEVNAFAIKDALPGTVTGTGTTITIGQLTTVPSDADGLALVGATWDMMAGTTAHTTGTITYTGGVYTTGATNTPAAVTDASTGYRVAKNGIRFQVNFTVNTGNLADFQCIITDRFSQTEERILRPATATCSVSSSPTFVGAAGSVTSKAPGAFHRTVNLTVRKTHVLFCAHWKAGEICCAWP
jgi:hypothetical protein